MKLVKPSTNHGQNNKWLKDDEKNMYYKLQLFLHVKTNNKDKKGQGEIEPGRKHVIGGKWPVVKVFIILLYIYIYICICICTLMKKP